MRRFAQLPILLFLLLALSACGQTASSAADLALGKAPWQNGDKVNYDWLDKSGNKVGSATFAFSSVGDAWVLNLGDTFPTLEQASVVRVDGQTLKPQSIEKTIKAQGTDATINATYQSGKLDIKAKVNGEDKAASTDYPANSLENDQLLVSLRALPFADNYEGKTTVVNSQNATKVATTVRVKGKEQVQTPAGAFEAWKVELDFGQAKQTAWYQVAAPRNLVQYDNGQIKLVLTK